jgi:hypothetical protein
MLFGIAFRTSASGQLSSQTIFWGEQCTTGVLLPPTEGEGSGRVAPSLNFASDKVATVVSPNATPEDCAENIQLNAASQELTPSQDQVICAVTDGQGAPNQPQRAKIARIVVSDVGQDQRVMLNVTAWEIPY